MNTDDICIARVTRPQGLKGWVRIDQVLEDDRVFQAGRGLTIAIGPARETSEIETFRKQHGRSVLKLRGIDSISQAERLVGAELRLRSSDLPAPEGGSFYTFQLKGCRVIAAGEYLGEVIDVLDSGPTQILQVGSGRGEILIPFAQTYLKRIDLTERCIEVDLPEELRELNR